MVINIKTALADCDDHVAQVRRRNTTLIDYYISPDPVPTAIVEYDPRLAKLQNRIKSIKKLNFSQLEQLIDDPDCYAASLLGDIIIDLLRAIVGFQRLFERHYDPNIFHRRFYTATFVALQHAQNDLQRLSSVRVNNLNRPRAENLVGHRNNENTTSSHYHFCRGAIQLLNGRDHGSIAAVADKDLLASNRADLANRGGAFLWWQCPIPSCPFRLRFHIVASQASSIHNNSEVRRHPSAPRLEYRPLFLIKSHLHSTSNDGLDGQAKYGCLFCFAEGNPLEGGSTAFLTEKELAMHICGAHKDGKLPPAMVLEKIEVAVDGRCPANATRWSANILAG